MTRSFKSESSFCKLTAFAIQMRTKLTTCCLFMPTTISKANTVEIPTDRLAKFFQKKLNNYLQKSAVTKKK